MSKQPIKTIDPNIDKKKRFLEYFVQLPSQKLAGASIGVSEDTIVRWKAADEDFAYQIEQCKAQWALKNVKSVKSKEWLLERLMRTTFAPPKQKTDITSGGKPIPILGGITNVQPDNSDKEDSAT